MVLPGLESAASVRSVGATSELSAPGEGREVPFRRPNSPVEAGASTGKMACGNNRSLAISPSVGFSLSVGKTLNGVNCGGVRLGAGDSALAFATKAAKVPKSKQTTAT